MAPACRLALGFLLSCALLVAGASSLPVAAQSSCDWESYPDFCVPPDWEVGDLDCADISAAWFTVYPPDPHGFDDDYDGYGCEGMTEGTTSEVSETEGIVASVDEGVAPEVVESAPVYEEPVAIAADCDPSYPDVCIPPGPPYLNCDDIGVGNFTVLPPDPHGFDGNGNGVGCEA